MSDVEMRSAKIGNLQCQESDKKDVSSETIDRKPELQLIYES